MASNDDGDSMISVIVKNWKWQFGLVSHQTAGAKPIRGVGLGGARVILIDLFFFAPALQR
jgi:hypothetical protein